MIDYVNYITAASIAAALGVAIAARRRSRREM